MNAIKQVFWNPRERRLRAFWRLLIQGLLAFLLLLVLQGSVGIAAVGMMAQSGISTGELTSARVQEFMMQSPVLIQLATAAMFIAFVASVWLAGRFLDRRRFADFGFDIDRAWWIDFGFGLILGAVLMLLVFLAERALGWVTVTETFATPSERTFAIAILFPLTTFILVGIYEELFNRGYWLQNLAEGLNFGIVGPGGAIIIATLLSSALFGVQHALNPNSTVVSTFNLFLAGATILALGYLLTGELAIPIGVHITWNFFQGNVFGFPVSGISFSRTTVFAIQQGGPELWTGGAFGPEAGLIGVAAMLLGSLLIAWWVRRRYGHVGLDVGLAEPPARVQRTDTPAG